ncbi:MAG: sulfatase, partial [Verrucomicrobiae bacterium]|nr:sulfatase [Verrucomicrobiae bacterium]
DSAVRYWAVLGYQMRGGEVVRTNRELLLPLVKDEAPAVAVAAAEALGIHGDERDVAISLRVLLEHASVEVNSVWVAMQALNAIDAMGSRADGIRPVLKSLPTEAKGVPGRYASYVPRLIAELTKDVP